MCRTPISVAINFAVVTRSCSLYPSIASVSRRAAESICSVDALASRTIAEYAKGHLVTCMSMRASGVNYDIRKVDGYGIYNRFKFRVPLGDHW